MNDTQIEHLPFIGRFYFFCICPAKIHDCRNRKIEKNYKITDTYMLGEDGKSLSLDRKDENNTNGEVWESIALYTKLPGLGSHGG